MAPQSRDSRVECSTTKTANTSVLFPSPPADPAGGLRKYNGGADCLELRSKEQSSVSSPIWAADALFIYTTAVGGPTNIVSTSPWPKAYIR